MTTHVEHILAKLHCSTRAELAARAVGEGLVLADQLLANDNQPAAPK